MKIKRTILENVKENVEHTIFYFLLIGIILLALYLGPWPIIISLLLILALKIGSIFEKNNKQKFNRAFNYIKKHVFKIAITLSLYVLYILFINKKNLSSAILIATILVFYLIDRLFFKKLFN